HVLVPRQLRPRAGRRGHDLRRRLEPDPRVAARAGLADPRGRVPRRARILPRSPAASGRSRMSEPDLFAGQGQPPPSPPDALGDEPAATAPLAARMRPRSLDEFVGQEHVLGPGRALRELIEKDAPGSIILWGPPGSGKTTIARII